MVELPPEIAARALSGLPVGVALVRDGRYQFVNEAFCAIAGHPQEALIGKCAFSIVAPEEQQVVQGRHLARQQGAPVPPQYEVTVITADGTRRRAELEPRVISAQETLLVARSLGTRPQDRELLTALGALQARVQRERSVAAVLDIAVRGLRELGFEACVGQRIGDECVMVAHAFRPEVDQLVGLIFTRGTHGPVIPLSRIPITQAAMESGQPFFRDDAFAAVARLAQKAGVDEPTVARLRARVQPLQVTISPITVRGQGWGVLMALAGGLRSNDAAALALFASQVASSIEVAQTIENLETIHQIALLGAELTQDALIRKVLPLLCKATQSDTAAILLRMPDQDHLVLAGATFETSAGELANIPLKGSLTGAVFETQRPKAISIDELPEGARAGAKRLGLIEGAVVPLAVDGRIGGTLHLGRKTGLRYSEDDLRAAEMLSTQTALQLERARLYEESRRRVEDLSLINELGAAISRHLNLDEVFSVAVRHVSRIVGVRNTFLMLLDPTGQYLTMAATNAVEPGSMAIHIPVSGQSAASEAVRTLLPVTIPDTVHDSRTAKGLADRFGHRALLALPIVSEGRPVGALVLGETRGPRRFASGEVERAVEVGNQLGSAIVNARLYEDLKRSYEQLGRTQQELVKRERLAALGELSAQVAHEVRNPLGVIFNSVATLKRIQTGKGAGQQLLAVLEEEADRLNRMVNDLLDFAGPASARVRPEKLESVLCGALEAAAGAVPSEHITVQLAICPTLTEVPVDAQMLRQAVVNLVVNAIQAMPSGGVINVRAAPLERSGKRIAKLDIQDNGPGMPEAVAARAFEPFFTTRAAGTGLGLAVVKRIAEAHGGEVAMQSEEGRGSTFTLFLPLPSPDENHAPVR